MKDFKKRKDTNIVAGVVQVIASVEQKRAAFKLEVNVHRITTSSPRVRKSSSQPHLNPCRSHGHRKVQAESPTASLTSYTAQKPLAVIHKLKPAFAIHVIPETGVSDNGPQYECESHGSADGGLPI